MMAGGAAALVADFGVSKATATDMLTELSRPDITEDQRVAVAGDIFTDLHADMNRQVFLPPQTSMIEESMIWYSVADVADVWAEQLAPQLHGLVRTETASPYEVRRLKYMCREMARKIDADLRDAAVKEDRRVLVETPKLRRSENGSFEIVAGLESKASIMGNRFRVGYIQEDLILPSGVTGSTTDSDSVSGGSNPSGAAKIKGRSFVDAFMAGFDRA